MIVKIWPIKADYAGDPGKVGGVNGLKYSLDYVSDSEKVIGKETTVADIQLYKEPENDDGFIDGDIIRVVSYMADQDKIENKYISGYLCDPEIAIKEFQVAKEITLCKAGKSQKKVTGAVAFHIVQSFPSEINISDEEVHQCGIELCEKINTHQAVICSHVHPVKDKKTGNISGKNKHNHILINAYIHPSKLDPKRPKTLKYDDCKRTYAQLRVWNDQIAIDHGLPIIRNPDDEKTYSWIETDAINKGQSWKERIRLDIEGTRRVSRNWQEFKEIMEAGGYIIQEGVHVSYIAPDGKHKVRGKTLGQAYTKESLELYWSINHFMWNAVMENIQENSERRLSDFLETAEENFTVGVPLGPTNFTSHENLYFLPLSHSSIDSEAIRTYFDENERYDIYDEDGQIIASATGAELYYYLEKQQEQVQAGEKKGNPKDFKEYHNKKKYYINPAFRNSQTGSYYRTNLYDENGQRRTLLELILILALTVLKKEEGLWVGNTLSSKYDTNPFYSPTDYKIQQTLDTIRLAREENVDTPAELAQRIQMSGAALSRAKAALKKTNDAKNRMEILRNTITQYNNTKNLAERIFAFPEGAEKEQLLKKYNSVLSQYKKTKTLMYRYHVSSERDIQVFEQEYEQIQKDIHELEKRYADEKETYRKLKRIHYHVELAQNVHYCYGPDYSQKEQLHKNREVSDSTIRS